MGGRPAGDCPGARPQPLSHGAGSTYRKEQANKSDPWLPQKPGGGGGNSDSCQNFPGSRNAAVRRWEAVGSEGLGVSITRSRVAY